MESFRRRLSNKDIPNRIYIKQSFASYKMDENKSIEENLDKFLKLVDDLASLNINVSDGDQAIQPVYLHNMIHWFIL